MKLEGNSQKETMNLFLICFMLFFAGVDGVSASVTYDAGTNTIYLENETNTLASIYGEISDPSVLSYDGGTNTYTLSANISGRNGVDADLVLGNATLIINSSASDRYAIKTWSDLTITNIVIKPADYTHHWKIWSYARFTSYSVSVTDSDISGGVILVRPNGYQTPSTPIIIRDNKFHDTTMENPFTDYPLTLWHSSAENAYLYNNTFKNIHITTGSYNGILGFNGYSGITVDRLYIHNCSVNSYGVTYFYGSQHPGATISNFEIKNFVGHGLTGKEFGEVIYSNGTITNVSGDAIHFYYSPSYGHMNYYIWNVTIDGVGRRGISNNGYSDNYTVDIYDVKINDVDTVYWISGPSIYYITNSIASNYTTYFGRLGEAREYQLADIYVVDENGDPIENAVVTIEAVDCDVGDCSINRNLEALNQTVTLSNGHTPLPNEDKNKTIALLRYRKNASTERNYSYNITAEKYGYTSTVAVTPDASWYRQYPDTYQNTTTIVLPMSAAPIFYDDFSDGRFQNRTGTDPWGRPLPEWRAEGGYQPSDPGYFNASNGSLYMSIPGGGYYTLQANFTLPGDEYYRLSFDIISHIPESTQDYFYLGLLNAGGDMFHWGVKNDWHNWYSAVFANGDRAGLAGISQAPSFSVYGGNTTGYATGIQGPLNGTVYHYRIERHPDHKIFITRSGEIYPEKRVWGSWANSNRDPAGLDWEQTHAGNIELWDNPHLYHHSPCDGGGTPDNPYGDGAFFPNITVEGKFMKIELGWFHDNCPEKAFAIDNIIFYSFNETGTGTISGAVTNTSGALIQGATVSTEGYSNTTNSTGGYTITLPAGNYIVTASAAGYQNQSQNAAVLENQTTEVNFILTVTSTTTTSTTTTSETTSTTSAPTTTTIKKKNGGGGGGGGGFSAVPIRKETCFDGLMNCHDDSCEDGVDCGGPCEPCPSCEDGIQNQGEEGVDCGGPCELCITTSTTSSIKPTTTTVATTTSFTISETTTTTAKITTMTIPAEEKEFPWIWVAAAAMVTGGVVFLAVKRGRGGKGGNMEEIKTEVTGKIHGR